jgi:hypothetical protein
MTTRQGESINTSATAQFQDGDHKKIITGKVVEDHDVYIIIECEHARYRLNKTCLEWIKYDR